MVLVNGVVRLLLCDSRITAGCMTQASHICSFDHPSEIQISRGENPKLIIQIPNLDSYDGFFIDSTYDTSIIESISLIINDVNIVSISGILLKTLKILSGSKHYYGMIQIPFPRLELCGMTFTRVDAIITPKYSETVIDSIRKQLSSELEKYLIEDIIKIVYLYIDGIDASVALWANAITEEKKVLDKRMENTSTKFIIQTQEELNFIGSMNDIIKIKTNFCHLVSKIIMVFSRADDPEEEPLPIMISGELSFDNLTAFTWTERQAYLFDKVSSKSHVPEEPIYTLTFDPNPLNNSYTIPSSRINFSKVRDASFSFKIIPQKFQVKLRISAINTNVLMSAEGILTIRHI